VATNSKNTTGRNIDGPPVKIIKLIEVKTVKGKKQCYVDEVNATNLKSK
jgi:hypothetical protein